MADLSVGIGTYSDASNMYRNETVEEGTRDKGKFSWLKLALPDRWLVSPPYFGFQ
jgi:hypothetical protein